MTPAARLSAAIEILQDMFTRHRPSSEALRDWGKSHRFAGSADRAAIGNLVYDVQRRRGSLGWLMQSDEPRAHVLALFAKFWCDVSELQNLCTGENHSPHPLTADEIKNLNRKFDDAPDFVRGFYPEWLNPYFESIYGDKSVNEGAALAMRAPIDIRINSSRTKRELMLEELQHFKAQACALSPIGIRIPLQERAGRTPHVEKEGAYLRGLLELQDEASQLASILCDAQADDQILDYCAGGGGKTLALSALMQNKGQITATDSDKHRLAPIYERLQRAQARNVQVKNYDKIEGQFDKVVLDVPCTGTGAWRRKPDGKWKLKPQNILDRNAEQDSILQKGASFVKSGGELIYITCSILQPENEDRIAAFLNTAIGAQFMLESPQEIWGKSIKAPLPPQPEKLRKLNLGLRFSPFSSDTDGFYICKLKKNG